MLQKMTLQELQNSTFATLKKVYYNATARKRELESAKAAGGAAWTEALQSELDDTTIYIVDIEEVLDEKSASADSISYEVKAGAEKMIHLSIVKGRRFNSMTGKEESKPFIQIFTFSEWQLFKKNFVGLGYSIMNVLHDPYGEAEKYVVKND